MNDVNDVRSASVRVYGPLNDFLTVSRRQATLVCRFDGTPSVKDLLESIGVPHPEIDVVVANGRCVSFEYRVRAGDRVAAYPAFCAFELPRDVRLGPLPQPEPRFVLDVHLGRLAAYLRLAGFDAAYRNDYDDPDIVAISAADDRAVLTRDVGLLKHRAVARGYFLRETEPGRQLVEVLRQFDLVAFARPFTRCLRCNSQLHAVPKDRVEHLIPPRAREQYREFSRCPACSRIYWQGTHHSRMTVFLETAFRTATGVVRRRSTETSI